MFAEGHNQVNSGRTSFGGNLFSENMKLTIFDQVYVVICHFVCYETKINQSEPQKNFSKLLDNM